MMIAMAATSARSDRARASFFLRVIEVVELFSVLVSLRLSGLVYFALAFPSPCDAACYAQLLFQSGCFDFASPQKSSEWFQHRGGFCQSVPESSNIFFIHAAATILHG
jgi:hypothetical protein